MGAVLYIADFRFISLSIYFFISTYAFLYLTFFVLFFDNYFAPMDSLPLFIVPAGTKFFMDGFCKSLRMELKGSNVR